MGYLSHTVLLTFSYFHPWNLRLYPFQKWSRNQTATLSGERGMDTSSSSSSSSLGWKKYRHYSLPSLRSFRQQWHVGQPLCHTALQCLRSLWHFLLPRVRLALHSVLCLLWVSPTEPEGAQLTPYGWHQLCWALLPAQALPWICTSAAQVTELS